MFLLGWNARNSTVRPIPYSYAGASQWLPGLKTEARRVSDFGRCLEEVCCLAIDISL
jgi:hypothetical protein